MRVDLANLTKSLNSTHSRHPNIHDDSVGLLFFEQFNAGFNAICGVHLIVRFQEHAQALARTDFVIDNENLGAFGTGGHSSSAASEAGGLPQTGRKRKKRTRKFI